MSSSLDQEKTPKILSSGANILTQIFIICKRCDKANKAGKVWIEVSEAGIWNFLM
jgi:hypothetical protein